VHRRLQRDRNDLRKSPGHCERHRHAGEQPDRNAEQRDQADLREIDGKDRPAARAERFQRRERIAFAVEIMLHRIGDADPAHQQRRQADEREKLRKAPDIVLKPRRGTCARACFPAGVGESLARIFEHGRERRFARIVQPDAIGPAHHAARLHQSRRAQGFVRNEQPRREPHADRELVGFCDDPAADAKLHIADADDRARLDAEAYEQSLVRHGAIGFVFLSKRGGERHRRFGNQAAGQRIDAVDGFQFDERRLAVGRARHGAHGRDFRNRSAARKKGLLFLARLPERERKGDIAAENHRAFARQTVRERT
jgi:hypothetical protein